MFLSTDAKYEASFFNLQETPGSISTQNVKILLRSILRIWHFHLIYHLFNHIICTMQHMFILSFDLWTAEEWWLLLPKFWYYQIINMINMRILRSIVTSEILCWSVGKSPLKYPESFSERLWYDRSLMASNSSVIFSRHLKLYYVALICAILFSSKN